MSSSMSAAQATFIGKLVAERTDLDATAFVDTITAQRLTSNGASALIEKLLTMPAKVGATPTAAPAVPERTNAYPGKCGRCQQQVAAHEGLLLGQRGAWRTEHRDGQCPQPVAATEPVATTKRGLINELLEGVSDGTYAVPCWTGANDLTFVKVGTNKGFYDPSLKGHRYIRNVVGGKGDLPVGIEWVRTAIEAIKVDPKGAMGLAGRTLKACGKCGRELTDETSRLRGIGPDCWAGL